MCRRQHQWRRWHQPRLRHSCASDRRFAGSGAHRHADHRGVDHLFACHDSRHRLGGGRPCEGRRCGRRRIHPVAAHRGRERRLDHPSVGGRLGSPCADSRLGVYRPDEPRETERRSNAHRRVGLMLAERRAVRRSNPETSTMRLRAPQTTGQRPPEPSARQRLALWLASARPAPVRLRPMVLMEPEQQLSRRVPPVLARRQALAVAQPACCGPPPQRVRGRRSRVGEPQRAPGHGRLARQPKGCGLRRCLAEARPVAGSRAAAKRARRPERVQ